MQRTRQLVDFKRFQILINTLKNNGAHYDDLAIFQYPLFQNHSFLPKHPNPLEGLD